MLKVLDVLAQYGDLAGIVSAALLLQLRQHSLDRLFRAALQNIIDGPDTSGPVSQPECRRVGHLQIERNALADVQAAADCFIVVHVSLLK